MRAACAARLFFPHLSNQRVIFLAISLPLPLLSSLFKFPNLFIGVSGDNDDDDVFVYLILKYLRKLNIELC